MSTTLPVLTETIDDKFTQTWYEIRAKAIDNILEANILWLAIKDHGSMVSQNGGRYIERTVSYDKKSTQRFDKGSVLTQSEPKTRTAALWDWRYFLVDINRSFVDDNQNAGAFKISDYVSDRLTIARDTLVNDLDQYLFQWGAYYSGDPQPNALYDICPCYTAETAVGDGSASDSQASGTSNGGITRANAWWRNWVAYDDATETVASKIAGPTNEPYSLNLVPDMRHFWNSVTANQESPNFIMTNQSMYEAYEDEASDKQMVVQSAFTRKAIDLGFEAFTFKGATMTYSGRLTENHLFMLNLNHVEMPYHPNAWFDMTEWKTTANQLERVAYIVCMTPGLITAQPRRHGVMEYAS